MSTCKGIEPLIAKQNDGLYDLKNAVAMVETPHLLLFIIH